MQSIKAQLKEITFETLENSHQLFFLHIYLEELKIMEYKSPPTLPIVSSQKDVST